MIPLVFFLAAILIVAAVALFVVDRRRSSSRTTAVASPSSPSLHDGPSDPTGEATDVAAEDVVSEQSVSSDSSDSEDDSATEPVETTGSVEKSGSVANTDSGVAFHNGAEPFPEPTDSVEPETFEDEYDADADFANSDVASDAADSAGAADTLSSEADDVAHAASVTTATSAATTATATTATDSANVESDAAVENTNIDSAGTADTREDTAEFPVAANDIIAAASTTPEATPETAPEGTPETDAEKDTGTERSASQETYSGAEQQATGAPQLSESTVPDGPAQPFQPNRMKSPRPVAPVRRRLSGRRVRQLRKAWAQEHNATYSRVDHELPSYWQRTPDGDARAVVSGFAFGREMHIADVGGITTIAIRRSVSSDEVFELRRGGGSALPHVATEAGLAVAATNPELIHRIFDDRATRMLIDVHPAIARMWSENSWSLAQLIDNSVPEDWDGALKSLSAFSDIARRLPPVEGETVAPDAEQWDPTRLQLTEHFSDSGSLVSDGSGRGHLQAVPNPRRKDTASADSQRADSQSSGSQNSDSGDPDVENRQGAEPLDVEEIGYAEASSSSAATGDTASDDSQWSSQSNENSTVVQAIDGSSWRPVRDTPLDPTTLPSRSMARKMGANVGDSEDIGDVDRQIPALGEDPEHSQVRSSQGRVVRSNVKPSSIFSDAAPDARTGEESTGTEPETTAPEHKDPTPDSSDE